MLLIIYKQDEMRFKYSVLRLFLWISWEDPALQRVVRLYPHSALVCDLRADGGLPAAQPEFSSVLCRPVAVGEHKEQRGENNIKYSSTKIQKSPPHFSRRRRRRRRSSTGTLHLFQH